MMPPRAARSAPLRSAGHYFSVLGPAMSRASTAPLRSVSEIMCSRARAPGISHLRRSGPDWARSLAADWRNRLRQLLVSLKSTAELQDWAPSLASQHRLASIRGQPREVSPSERRLSVRQQIGACPSFSSEANQTVIEANRTAGLAHN